MALLSLVGVGISLCLQKLGMVVGGWVSDRKGPEHSTEEPQLLQVQLSGTDEKQMPQFPNVNPSALRC